ncbi:putative glutathione transferase [Helianthus anomalus]
MNPATQELKPVYQEMAEEVKLYGVEGINYEFIQEDLDNKSPDLLKFNPVYKKVPVLLHNGNPISESLVIIEYIDDVWKGVPIMPNDCHPALFKAIGSHGEEQAIAEAHELLQFLENELNVKGSKFFGGDNINLVDICAGYIAHWVVAAEEALGIEVVTKDKFPKIAEWCGNYINCQVVKDGLPPRERLVAYYKGRFGNTTRKSQTSYTSFRRKCVTKQAFPRICDKYMM